MSLDCSFVDPQHPRDLAVGLAFDQKPEYFELSPGKDRLGESCFGALARPIEQTRQNFARAQIEPSSTMSIAM